MKSILALWVLLVAFASAFAAEPSAPLRYWSDTWRGWHFYEEPEAEVEHRAPTAPRQARDPSKPVPSRPRELIEFEQLQKTLEETRHIAVMRPTEANVRRYMELEAQVVARASTFADMAQRIAWASPELDPSVQGRPVNAKALEVFDQLQMAQRSEAIGALGRDHVLLFFFRGDCPYCHAFAPTLQAFQARHGIRVVAVSVDGGSMPGFAGARRDNGISRTLQVSQVPAVYLAQPFTGVITPIGFGVLSEAQLLERVAIVGAAPRIGGRQAVAKHSGAAP
ncbi:MAG TPA: conjugal transfer protein TraF [Rubrivivax sp.]|nr:conjugal transfer protein TraF [Rubrivivax sp.]